MTLFLFSAGLARDHERVEISLDLLEFERDDAGVAGAFPDEPACIAQLMSCGDDRSSPATDLVGDGLVADVGRSIWLGVRAYGKGDLESERGDAPVIADAFQPIQPLAGKCAGG
jgi:hypothetical protein